MVCLLVGLASTWSQAGDGITLSPADEQAYQSAQAAWERLAKVHEEAGIPPPGDPPKREDFIDYAAQRDAAATHDAIARTTAEAKWQQRIQVATPYLRAITPPAERTDYRAQVALQEQKRLLQIADERFFKQPHVEQELDDIAGRYAVDRVIRFTDGVSINLAGEIDGHLLWIGSFNQIAAASIGADQLWPTNTVLWPSSSTGLDLTGDGVTLGMWEPQDSAVRETHDEFQSRVIQMDQSGTNPIPLAWHATGVAGTMAAGGVEFFAGFPGTGTLARGVAYEVNIDAYDTRFFSSEIADAAAGNTNNPGLRLSNHSYGLTSGWRYNVPATGLWSWWGFLPIPEDPKFGWYTPNLAVGYGSTQLDTFMAEEASRKLFIYAAGNDRLVGPGAPVDYWYLDSIDGWILIENPAPGSRLWISGDGENFGFDTIPPLGTAKNVLTVGSVRDVYHIDSGQVVWGYTTNSVVTPSSWSAAGPTDDGRIKPDVVAVGEADQDVRNMLALVTSYHDADDAYQFQSGTSFAAPAVTAAYALMLQRRKQLFPALEPDIDDWRGSTLKALAIHTADDLGEPGPSYITGWGLFNAVSLVRQVELDAFDGRGTHIKELFLDVDETISWWVYSDGSEPLKVTIAWSDPAGDPPTTVIILDDPTPMLVNNLDLTIQDEAQTQTWMPWILDPDLTNKTEAVRASAATTGYDDRNNVEQVYIADPEEGLYLLTITHAGGHSGGPSPTGQWVSVISSGDIPLPPRSVELELAPAGDEILLTFDTDPGAYLLLETTTDLNDPQSWNLLGQVVTESVTNSVLVETDGELRFWRFRRETP